MADNIVIKVTNLNKSYDKRKVVDNLSLTVKKGEIFGFLGPNGSGKTTSIRMLCGLITPDSGSGSCLGYNISTESALIKRQIGYMTQHFSLWDDLTVYENLNFIAEIYLNNSRRKQIVEDILARFKLTEKAKQLAGSLSGGWKQRLALASCMLHKPKLLLLDEPTAGVDPKARRDFWQELHLLASEGISVLVSTHYMDEAERCHKLAYIYNGKLITQGSSSEIIANNSLYTYSVSGNNLPELIKKFNQEDSRLQTILFGSTLHISSENEQLITEALKHLGTDYKINAISTSLEDVFIYLMSKKW